MEKIPINEDGNGNCCPECGSLKIDVIYQFPLYVRMNLRTGKEIITDYNGKRKNKPSNRLLAIKYKSAQRDAQMWQFECEKCGWLSEPFVP